LIRLGSRNVGETEEYIRLSYVGSEETINEGLRRIKKAIEGKGS
jgi:aspartate/methionine/tyrosine aminotransferase